MKSLLAIILALSFSISGAAQTAMPTLIDYFGARGNRVGWSMQKTVDATTIHLEHSSDGVSWAVYAVLPLVDGYRDTTVSASGLYRLRVMGGIDFNAAQYSNAALVTLGASTASAMKTIYTLDGHCLGVLGYQATLTPGKCYLIKGDRTEVICVTN